MMTRHTIPVNKYRAILVMEARVVECGPDGEPNGDPPKHRTADLITIERPTLDEAINELNSAFDRLNNVRTT